VAATRGPYDAFLTVVLLALGIYFSVLVAKSLRGYLLFRRIRGTALVTWPLPRPGHFPFLLALGFVSAGVAVLNSYLQRPFHHVYSQGVMAAYFMLFVPLTMRIHRGLYRDGVWADTGFLPYGNIGRMAFVERPEIVLVLVPRRGSGALRLPVPASEYGAVRRVLEDKIRERAVNMEQAILGL
jgi:hypothetical protein